MTAITSWVQTNTSTAWPVEPAQVPNAEGPGCHYQIAALPRVNKDRCGMPHYGGLMKSSKYSPCNTACFQRRHRHPNSPIRYNSSFQSTRILRSITIND